MWLWGGEGWGGEGWSAVRGRGRGCGDGEERGGEGRAHRNTGSKVVWGQFYDSTGFKAYLIMLWWKACGELEQSMQLSLDLTACKGNTV